jgi:hypothetical protein
MSLVAARRFSLRSSIVRGRVWYTSKFKWFQTKKKIYVREVRRSWWPFDRTPAPNPSHGKNLNQLRTSPAKWSGAPSCWKSIRSRTASGISSTYGYNWRYRSAFTPPSCSTGPKTEFQCIGHHTIILVLVWLRASTAASGLSCAQYAVLCRFTHPFKCKHATSLNISSARILCGLKLSHLRSGQDLRAPGRCGSQKCQTIGTWRWQGRQPYAQAAFTPRRYWWYSFLLEVESTIMRPEGLSEWKIPMTP